jgi:hypothetical protein
LGLFLSWQLSLNMRLCLGRRSCRLMPLAINNFVASTISNIGCGRLLKERFRIPGEPGGAQLGLQSLIGRLRDGIRRIGNTRLRVRKPEDPHRRKQSSQKIPGLVLSPCRICEGRESRSGTRHPAVENAKTRSQKDGIYTKVNPSS